MIEKLLLPGIKCNNYDNLNNQQLKYLSEDPKIPYCLLKNEVETNNYMIYFHGNGETINDSADFIIYLMKKLKTNAILVEYPGYGTYKSEQITYSLIKANALQFYQFFKKEYNLTKNNTYVLGRSTGSGPAFYLTANEDVTGLIALSSFQSLTVFVKEKFPQDELAADSLSDQLRNDEEIKKVKCPVVIIHGQKDKLIKCQHSINLAKNENAKLFLIPNMAHNDVFAFQEQICGAIVEVFNELKL